MKQLKVGVFGAGRGLSMIHQLLDSEEARLVAVCDKYVPLLDRCRQVASEANYEGITYYTTFDEFFQHDMDAVILANYANEHVPFGIRLLESGRHIMTEVLTCATMDEAVRLIEAVEKTGLVYAYAENYCYTPVRLEMARRYKAGDIGELMYAEGEYVHDCSSIWPQITYGERNHWRNLMPSTFYCTHSLGPILYMTGLRPVKVSAFECPNMPYMRKLGTASGTMAVEMVTLENGAIVKSLHFGIKHVAHSNYQLNGTLGGLRDEGGGNLHAYIEQPDHNGQGEHTIYQPQPELDIAAKSGHGGGDFWTTYNFLHAILGDEEAKKRSINVYDAVDMCIPGILGYKSIVNGNASFDVPNLRNKAERDAFRGDTFCTFPDIAGDQYVSNNIHDDTPIPDEVFDEVRRRWENGIPG